MKKQAVGERKMKKFAANLNVITEGIGPSLIGVKLKDKSQREDEELNEINSPTAIEITE